MSEAGIEGRIFRDDMTKADIRGRRIEALAARQKALDAGDQTTLVVATIRALSLNSGPDLITLLKVATDRKITVRAITEEIIIPPSPDMHCLALASLAWERCRHIDQTAQARKKGSAAAAATYASRRENGVTIAASLWPLPHAEISTKEISQRAGLSVATLYRALGRRSRFPKLSPEDQ